MNKQIIMLLSLTSTVHAENIFTTMWNKLKARPDLTEQHPGVTKQYLTDNLYVYRLSRDELTKPVPIKHPDIKPVEQTINKTPQTKEVAHQAVSNDKQVLFGSDSPLRDDAVAAAWERADAAQKALEAHRDYMEKFRQSKKNVQNAKQITPAINQIDE